MNLNYHIKLNEQELNFGTLGTDFEVELSDGLEHSDICEPESDFFLFELNFDVDSADILSTVTDFSRKNSHSKSRSELKKLCFNAAVEVILAPGVQANNFISKSNAESPYLVLI